LLAIGAHIIGPNASRALSTWPPRKNAPKKNTWGRHSAVSVTIDEYCGARAGVCHAVLE